jgi:3-oxoacyl-[acyl-carrier protein] reductase
MLDLKLSNKIVLITGGSRGIGKTISQKFAEQGCKINFTYKNNDEKANETKIFITNINAECNKYKVSADDDTKIKQTVNSIINKYKKIDILINNAGIIIDNFLMFMKEEQWDNVINTNLKGSIILTKYVSEHMKKQKYGKIVNIASTGGIRGVIGQTNYSASKAGLIGFTKALGLELCNYNINVNSVAPGIIDTDMTTSMKKNIREAAINEIPFKRAGTTEDVANMVLFLASDLSGYITGQTIPIDGGLTI